MSSYVTFVKHILIVSTIDILGVIQSLIFLPIITRALGVESYGIWFQLKVTMSLLVPFTFLGLHEALVRFLPGAKNKEEIKEGIYSSGVTVFLVTSLFAAILIIFSKEISFFLKFNQLYVVFLASLIIFESLNTMLLVIMKALRKIAQYFWFMVFMTIV